MSVILIVVSIIVLAAIASVMASSALRERIVGNSPLANAAVPLFAAGLVWAAHSSSSILSTWVSDFAPPKANIEVFIEDVVFQFPQISSIYKERSLTQFDVNNMQQEMRKFEVTIQLTDAEVQSLNSISNQSHQAGARNVSTSLVYTMEDIVELTTSSFAYYFDYVQWEQTSKQWSEFLQRNAHKNQESLMDTFVDEHVANAITTAGMLQAIIGMASIVENLLNLNPDELDCLADDTTTDIHLVCRNDNCHIDWGSYTSHMVSNSDSMVRRIAAQEFSDLLERGCITSLSRVFGDASIIFGNEHRNMKAYLEQWNRILSDRIPQSFSVVVTISNVGKYDTYIRREIRAAIGDHGSENKIDLTLVPRRDDDANRFSTLYLPIKSRAASTFVFWATLDDDETSRVHGAFNSGLNYIRVGVLASSGGSSEFVFSQIGPFSSEAKRRARQQIDEIEVAF